MLLVSGAFCGQRHLYQRCGRGDVQGYREPQDRQTPRFRPFLHDAGQKAQNARQDRGVRRQEPDGHHPCPREALRRRGPEGQEAGQEQHRPPNPVGDRRAHARRVHVQQEHRHRQLRSGDTRGAGLQQRQLPFVLPPGGEPVRPEQEAGGLLPGCRGARCGLD